MAAMAPDPAQLIRDGLAAWSRGDLAGALKGFDPDLEVVTSGVYPGLEPAYRGREGFEAFWTDFRGTWENIGIEIDRIVEGDQGRLAVVGRFRAKGRDGIPVERPVGMAFTVKDGLITRMQNFGTGDEALRAAGVGPAR